MLPFDDHAARKVLLTSNAFYVGHDGLLYHLDSKRRSNSYDSFSQLVVPASLRFEILSNVHDHVSGAHFGVHKTFDKIKQRYWWKGMYKDVECWCKSCTECSMRKSPRNSKKAPLLPIPVEGAFDRVAVDVLGPFPPSNKGNRYIVVFSDYLTRWCETFPVPSVEATEIARLLVDEIHLPKDCFEPEVPVVESASANEHLRVSNSRESSLLSEDENRLEQSQSHPDDIVTDDEAVFRAEKILKSRRKKGKMQYLVKWFDFPMSESTWEPEENILDKRLIDVFRRSRK